jgi:hypothetical protein
MSRFPAIVCLVLLSAMPLHAAQAPIVEAPPAAAPVTAPCCGVITPDGQRLIATLDGMDVEHHWLANEHVNWKTGRSGHDGELIPGDTHCSAFAAAVSLRLHVYLLRQPEHRSLYLASAQGRWLASERGQEEGWVNVDAAEAQRRANLGEFVVVNYATPNPRAHGHIAVIRPSEKTAGQFAQEGPEVTEAGGHNHNDWIAAKSFGSHPGAWPDGVRYYAHKVPWGSLSAQEN